jgi:hypothetical protein
VSLNPFPANSSPNGFNLGMAGEWHTWQLIWYLRAKAGMALPGLAGMKKNRIAESRAILKY